MFSFLKKKSVGDAPAAPIVTPEVPGAPVFDETTNAAVASGAPSTDAVSAAPTGAVSSEPADQWTPAPSSLDTSALMAPVEPPAGVEKADVGPLDPDQTAALQGPIIETIKTVFDPEIPVDIYELGLIYDVIVDADRKVLVKMTLTSPACPSAQQLPSEVRYKVKAVPGVTDAWVDIVWEPPWDKERMSETAKLSLGFF
jgi:FeS assembly SUF system protein